MSEMVERVAKAMEYVMIERANKFGTSRDASTALARAAIEAMREPTEAMIKKGSIGMATAEEDMEMASENRCPKCGDLPTYQTPDGTYWDGNAHFWRIAEPVRPSNANT